MKANKNDKDFLQMLRDSLQESQGEQHDSGNANTNTARGLLNTNRGIRDIVRLIEAESKQSEIPSSSRKNNTITDNGRLGEVFSNEAGTSRAESRESGAVSQTSKSVGNIYHVSSQLTTTEQNELNKLIAGINELNERARILRGIKVYLKESPQNEKETYFKTIKFHTTLFQSTLSPNQKIKSFNAIQESVGKIKKLIDSHSVVLNEEDKNLFKTANEIIDKHSQQFQNDNQKQGDKGNKR